MRNKHKFFWDLYALTFLLSALIFIVILWDVSSMQHQYYAILIAFNPFYLLEWVSANLRGLLLIVQGFAVINCVHKINLFSSMFWKTIFFSRIITDIFGYAYQKQELLSIWNSSSKVGLSVGIFVFGFYLPAYVFNYHLAFGKRH